MVYGNIAAFEPFPVSADDLLMRGTSMLTYNSNLLNQTHPERLADSAHRALELVGTGKVGIEITAEYELADVETATGTASSLLSWRRFSPASASRLHSPASGCRG